MKKKRTIYHLIVDRSGSMSDCIENTISGFNEQASKIKRLQEEYADQIITMGLTTFNVTSDHRYFMRNPEEVTFLDRETYRPSGGTALLDAIGEVCQMIERVVINENDKIESTVVVVILTDGHENASRSFGLEEIRRTISRLEHTGSWTFSFLGATLDAVEIAESMNIKRQNSMVFEKNSMKKQVWSTLTDSMDSYMAKKMNGGNLGDFFSKE